MEWNHVGSGRGEFELYERYGFVGEGSGSWRREVTTSYEGWRMKAHCKVLIVVISCIVAGVLLGLGLKASPHLVEAVARWRDSVWTAVMHSSPPGSREAIDESDCSTDPQTWSPTHHDLCCSFHQVGCKVDSASDCNEDDKEGWDVVKRASCCQRWKVGCPATTTTTQTTTVTTTTPPPYNCMNNLRKWVTDWAPAKKAWCCQHDQIACPPDPSKMLDAEAAG